MNKIDVLMFAMSNYSEWQRGVSNRNYHIVHELIKSERVDKVLIVEYLPLTYKRGLRNIRESMVRPPKGGTVVHRTTHSVLTKFSDQVYVYSDCMFFWKPDHVIKDLKRHLVRAEFGEFMVWSFFPPVMKHLRSLGQQLTVFDAVDNWAEHASYRTMQDTLRADYAYIKQNADIIFTVSKELLSLFDNQPNVYWIPNGVDVAHYQDLRSVVNRDIADMPKPIIGYIGVIQDRVDIDLICTLAQKNPSMSFAIVGPILAPRHSSQGSDVERKLRSFPNIHVLGFKPYDDAPAYIQQFDVGIIPHKANAFISSTNPMKLYEYLACGKPVVATAGAGAEQFADMVYIAKNPNDFNRKLSLALEDDTPEKHTQRIVAMQEHSWSLIAGHMLDIVEKKLAH
jgi:teichuronic acid biosynthesis glycosyltransferase TuaH